MGNASVGVLVAVGIAFAASAVFAAQEGRQATNGVPQATGTMYDGNNTQAPKLTLQGPMAPITEALEPSAAFAAGQRGAATSQDANAGGNSGNARAGGGG
jgi:hypothetical protein